MLITALARTPGTLLHRELSADDWSLEAHLLAVVADQLAVGNWQRQGKKGAPRPKPISPFARDRKAPERSGDTGGRTQKEIDDILAQMAGR